MAYDERDHDEANSLVTSNFKTDIYQEFPAGIYNMESIVDMRPVSQTEQV
ncbi:hypothetical protein PbDSM24746_38150 [Paenibacillus macerans]|nr:hypothetical protein PbDSM24746_38150 [Paenibacillus macerans]GBK70124.1 hypothetical protein PbJCM17693_38320 [Paenibacillus macerans]